MTSGRKRKRHERDASNSDNGVAACDGPVRRDLLRHAYTTVLTLREYALLKLPTSSRLRRKKISSLGKGTSVSELEAAVSEFLDSTLICDSKAILQTDNASYAQWLSFSQNGDESHVTISGDLPESENTLSELVDFAIWSHFNRQKTPGAWPKHLLCDGYRKRTKEGDPQNTSIPGVWREYPNHHAAALRRQPWPQVLALLGHSGQRVMVDLLIERSIFVTIDAGIGNYYQISGIPLSELQFGGNRSSSNEPRKSSDISLVRSRIFYARPVLTARGRVRHGFKSIHVLNRCCAGKDDGTSHHAEKLNASTTKLTMYMFPRQFGLHNVFTSNVNVSETAQKFQDYTSREEEIKEFTKDPNHCSKDGTPKLPKRLRGEAWRLIQRLQIGGSRAHESSFPLDERSQVTDLDKGQRRIEPSAPVATNDRQQIIPTPKPPLGGFQSNSVVELATSSSQVSAFCQAALTHIVPNDFWGTGETLSHNKAMFLRSVDHFIRLRRFETMTLHEIYQGMKTAHIPWLQPPGVGTQKASLTDIKKRCELFYEFLYYLFDSLLIPLIQTNFYVTESNTHRYQVFYFHHDVWRRIAEPTLSVMKSDMFEEMTITSANEILESRDLGFSQIRLLPKGQKLRPIMNLRRRQPTRTAAKVLKRSINSFLGPVHTALKFEKMTNPQRLASSLFSVSDMYAKLKMFKRSLPSGSSQLFFAKVDVQSAFDTIPQDAIIQLMKSIPSQQGYTFTKHAEVQPGERAMMAPEKTATKAIRRWHASVLARDMPPFVDRLRHGLASKKRNTVFVDRVALEGWDTESLLSLLADHVQRNLVKIGKKYYRQKRGIPQGSVLSSFLCNYFYADLERKHLGFLLSPDCLLMRLIDDFLLITLDKNKAVRFVETMHRGVPEYGVEVSPGKTLVNFDMQIDGKPVCKAGTTGFPYCGTRIDDRSLDITKDVEAKAAICVSNSLTVDYGRSAGQNFQRKVINAFKIQSHLMFFDTSHNAPRTVLDSLRGAFAETARKMWAYIRCLPKGRQPSTALITRTILKVSEVAFSIISSKSRKLRYPEYSCCIHKGQVMRYFLLRRKKQANYGPVIAWLKAQNKKSSAT
ncbi:telomerase ribonucleoprotein complex - RNA binding domain protein [Metarhizium robertsii]|uniref:Telomerase reverse transcriptase n=1 Tax=Metarhizium robertsii TaxID=568076 RepID=A0A0A1UYC0_9HYPO|nr:telomerase ribonucleoprotein complex - RNA binding domain protein [Metarhizium robertsii]